jgi:hypothetical protein
VVFFETISCYKLFHEIGIAVLEILSYPLSAQENTSTTTTNKSQSELEEVIVTVSPHPKSVQEIAGSFNLYLDAVTGDRNNISIPGLAHFC